MLFNNVYEFSALNSFSKCCREQIAECVNPLQGEDPLNYVGLLHSTSHFRENTLRVDFIHQPINYVYEINRLSSERLRSLIGVNLTFGCTLHLLEI
jgi:hypothetical protein